ncbi:MAG TPA: hypothetical protein VMT98_07400 [Verrucomicrobiae bacterium]|nr:hypothetical protein [Verrucomicrobiae bacterium]
MTDISAALPRPKVPVWRTAYDGYRLGIGAIFSSGAMFRFFVYGSVLSIAALGAEIYFLFSTPMNLSEHATNILALVIPFVTYIAMTAVQTPLGIAMQRRILLGDIPSRSYVAYAVDQRGRNYAFVLLLICGFYFLASLIEIPVTLLVYGQPFTPAEIQDDDTAVATYSSLLLLAWVVTFAVASLMSAKCAFMFPAVACDRPGSWRQAYAETRGIVWPLFVVFLVAFLPVALLYMVIFGVAFIASLSPIMAVLALGEGVPESATEQMIISMLQSPAFIIAYVIAGLGYMLSFVVTAAAAARAYQIRIERGMSGVADVFS